MKLGYALVALAAASWGTWPLILRYADSIAVLPAAMKGAIVMAVLTLASAVVMAFDRTRERASLVAWLGMAWLGVGDAMNFVLFFAAYTKTSIAVAVLTHYLTPIFVALGAPVVLKERGSAKTSLAVALSFAGLVVLLEPWHASASWVGAACGAGSAVFYASNVLVNKKLSRAFSAGELMFFHGLVATPLLALLVPKGAWALAGAEAHAARVVAIGAIGPGALAGLFFILGLRRVPAAHASTLTLLEPLVAVVVGSAFLAEPVTAWAAVGGAAILAGAWLVMTRGRMVEPG